MDIKEVNELVNKHRLLTARLGDLQEARHQLSAANSYADSVSCNIEVRQGVVPHSVKVACGMDVARPFVEAEAAKVEREIQAINQLFEKVG